MINQRIKSVRDCLELNQTDFGKSLGVTRSVILNIELNKVKPKDVFVDHLCEVFNVNKKWLEDGTGEMFLPNAKHTEPSEELIDLFDNLKPEFQEYVLQQIQNLLDIQTASNKDTDK